MLQQVLHIQVPTPADDHLQVCQPPLQSRATSAGLLPTAARNTAVLPTGYTLPVITTDCTRLSHTTDSRRACPPGIGCLVAQPGSSCNQPGVSSQRPHVVAKAERGVKKLR